MTCNAVSSTVIGRGDVGVIGVVGAGSGIVVGRKSSILEVTTPDFSPLSKAK